MLIRDIGIQFVVVSLSRFSKRVMLASEGIWKSSSCLNFVGWFEKNWDRFFKNLAKSSRESWCCGSVDSVYLNVHDLGVIPEH